MTPNPDQTPCREGHPAVTDRDACHWGLGMVLRVGQVTETTPKPS
jgi:hypothetical protein